MCASIADGTGVCADGQTPCAGLADCNTSADCPVGAVCAVGTCCSRNICIVADTCSVDPPLKFLKARSWSEATVGKRGA